jgi:uncharacterized membrane protein YwaF
MELPTVPDRADTYNYLHANYMFLCWPADAASPFFFLPWPWYILILMGIGVVTVFVLYSIFPITDWVMGARKKKKKAGADK